MKTSKHSTNTSSAANDGLIIFGEGYTEYFFYNKCVAFIRSVSNRKPSIVKVKNVEGIGNFIQYPLNCMKKFFIPQNKGMLFTVHLCYDTDVYELQVKPTFDWAKIVRDLKSRYVDQVIEVKQEKSIEDWLLNDKFGILDYLQLDKSTRIPNEKGLDAFKSLYRKANRVYAHGDQRDSQKLIEALDMNTLILALWIELQPLLDYFEVNDKSLFR